MVVAILLATVHWEWSWETRIYPTLSAPFFTYSTVRYQCLVANYTTFCSPSCMNVLRAVSHCVSRQQGYSCSSLVCTAVASSLVYSINESIITSTTMLPFQNASWGGRNYHWESALLFVPMTESALLLYRPGRSALTSRTTRVGAENLTNRRGNRIEYFVLPILIVLLVQIGAHMNNRGRIVYYHYPA